MTPSGKLNGIIKFIIQYIVTWVLLLIQCFLCWGSTAEVIWCPKGSWARSTILFSLSFEQVYKIWNSGKVPGHCSLLQNSTEINVCFPFLHLKIIKKGLTDNMQCKILDKFQYSFGVIINYYIIKIQWDHFGWSVGEINVSKWQLTVSITVWVVLLQ